MAQATHEFTTDRLPSSWSLASNIPHQQALASSNPFFYLLSSVHMHLLHETDDVPGLFPLLETGRKPLYDCESRILSTKITML